jgi:hypothetical protein
MEGVFFKLAFFPQEKNSRLVFEQFIFASMA